MKQIIEEKWTKIQGNIKKIKRQQRQVYLTFLDLQNWKGLDINDLPSKSGKGLLLTLCSSIVMMMLTKIYIKNSFFTQKGFPPVQ